jgi:hypothetical protein
LLFSGIYAAFAAFQILVPPLRRLTFGKRPKSKQKVLPLASGSRSARLPSFHHRSRGPPRRAIPGPSRLSRHPCRSTPSTTIPLGLLMGRFASSARLWASDKKPTHPTNVRRPCRSGLARDALASAFPFCFCLSLCHPKLAQTTRSPNPVRRPSIGAVERGVWHGCQTRHVGPWMARLADPRNSTVAREVERSETRMPGALSLWLLSLCASKEKVTRRKGEKVIHSQYIYGGR